MKRIVQLSIVILTVVLISFAYRFYPTKPTSFPNQNQAIKEINSVFLDAKPSKILDTITVENGHILVPFLSENNDYSISYWRWQNKRWEIVSVFEGGEPKILKIKQNDPSTYYFFWNMHPDDQIKTIDFYLSKNRNFIVTNGTEFYFPRIQMKKSVSLQNKPYGYLRLPKEWADVINTEIKINSANQPAFEFDEIPFDQNMTFGWIPYDNQNKEKLPKKSFNGSSFSNGRDVSEFVIMLNESELE
ncbi:MAG: hypothetical protein K0S34_1335 [Bacillales bacterium]|jgi:hypothetical protein|nr:hypothetical protein [Bacillales bacterium]